MSLGFIVAGPVRFDAGVVVVYNQVGFVDGFGLLMIITKRRTSGFR